MKTPARAARLVAVFLMVVAALFAAAPSRATAATDPCAQVPVDTNAIGSCNGSSSGGGIGGVMPSAAPTSTASAETTAPSAETAPSASAAPSATATASGDASSTPCDTTTAPCQWAQSSQSGAAAVAKAAADQYKNGLNMLGSGFLVPYAVMFGIGLIIMAIMLIIQVARMSDDYVARQELIDHVPHFFFYVPLMMLFPAMVGVFTDMTGSLGHEFVSQSKTSFGDFLLKLAEGVVANPLIGLLGGALVATFLLVLFIVFLVMWIFEDIAATYGIYLTTLLIPIAAAWALYPKQRRMFYRGVGLVAGIALVPVMTRFAWWVVFYAVGDQVSTGSIRGMLTACVIVAMSGSAPLLLSYIMPMVMPWGGLASGGAGGNTSANARETGERARDSVARVAEQFRARQARATGSSSRGSNAAGGAEDTAAPEAATGGGAAGAGEAGGAGAAGVGAAAIPLAAAALAWSAFKTTRGAGTSAASQVLSAAGGGGFSDVNVPTHARQRNGGGGTRSSNNSASSSSETSLETAASSSTPESYDGGVATPDAGYQMRTQSDLISDENPTRVPSPPPYRGRGVAQGARPAPTKPTGVSGSRGAAAPKGPGSGGSNGSSGTSAAGGE